MDVKEELKFFVKIHKNFFFRVGSGWGGGGGGGGVRVGGGGGGGQGSCVEEKKN